MIFKTQDLAKTIIKNNIFLFHGVNEVHKEEILKNLFFPKFKNVFNYF